MKRIAAACIIILFIFGGCSSSEEQIDVALRFRDRLLSSNGCSFNAKITADYGDELYSFIMQCSFDQAGNMKFSVVEPDSISGITGTIDDLGGALTFDDRVLAFEMLADDLITPVSAPFLMMKSLRSGYISACGKEGDGYILQIDDSYEENALVMDLWLDSKMNIIRSEFLWKGRRIISVDVSEFSFL